MLSVFESVIVVVAAALAALLCILPMITNKEKE